MLIFQDPSRPNAMLDALVSLASPDTTGLRILVAYTTVGGSALLIPRLGIAVGPGWQQLPKTVITSFDFGITEPDAVEYLVAAGVNVRIANLGEGGRIVLIPAASAFHPKAYIFDRDAGAAALVGSPNLTRRALTVNVEAAYIGEELGEPQGLEDQWNVALRASVPLTDDLLALYRERRPNALTRPTPAREPTPAQDPVGLGALQTFAHAVLDGNTDPREFTAFWIEAGSMSSSGSHAQLELPRRGNVFFGYSFNDYDDEHHTIGYPRLLARGEWFTNRPLTWHGNNRMERINLPTFAQSGLRYPGTAILFRRIEEGFALEVRRWASAEALAWRTESEAAGHMFRLGHNSDRRCGLL